ncbi:hypothetical protein PWT90_04974 [Aphanocladium album]|nr:hypothetical protein PWT90_04974 [Aphanocladium album]
MLSATTVFTALLAAGAASAAASDRGRVAFYTLEPGCNECLDPIDAACPGNSLVSDEFTSCYCPMANGNWDKVKQCVNDQSTNCYKDTKYIMAAFGSTCFNFAKDMSYAEYCLPENLKDPLVFEMTGAFCKDHPVSALTTSTISQTTGTVSKPASTSLSATTTASATATTPAQTHPASTNCTKTTVPTSPIIITGGASTQYGITGGAVFVLAAAVAAHIM